MLSNFRNSVIGKIGNKKTQTYRPDKIAEDIERRLDQGKIKPDQAMRELKSKLRYDLSEQDYRDIEREIGYNSK